MKELKSCGIFVIKYLNLSPYSKNWKWVILLSFGLESFKNLVFHAPSDAGLNIAHKNKSKGVKIQDLVDQR